MSKFVKVICMLAKSTNPSPYGNCFYPQYMMLSLESCESNDKRPFGAFFTYFSDEMSDIIWIQDFQLLFLLLRELPADNHAVCSNQRTKLRFLLHFGFFQFDIHKSEYQSKLSEWMKNIGQGEYIKGRKGDVSDFVAFYELCNCQCRMVR